MCVEYDDMIFCGHFFAHRRHHGVKQFLLQYRKGEQIRDDELKWGDEVRNDSLWGEGVGTLENPSVHAAENCETFPSILALP